MDNNTVEEAENVQIHLRVDAKLRDKLVELAKPAQRSLNKQIVFMLEQSILSSMGQKMFPKLKEDKLGDINNVIDTMVARDFSR
jgi:hypothetical protein|tara:strand:- start:158 stop:409 length:252 start_codon:yes stop_codon:yes gene_type:complete